MTSIRSLCIAAVFAAFAAAGARAGIPAITIYNTGVSNTGLTLPDGSIDPHYTVGPGGPPLVDSAISGTPAPDSISAWIKPSNNLGPGSYTYETTFTQSVAGTITINGQWSAAAGGLDIRLNGVSSGDTTPNPGNTSWYPFSITGASVVGTNTLDFLVAEDFGNPITGLRTEIFAPFGSSIPEPAALSLVSACGALLLARRRSPSWHR